MPFLCSELCTYTTPLTQIKSKHSNDSLRALSPSPCLNPAPFDLIAYSSHSLIHLQPHSHLHYFMNTPGTFLSQVPQVSSSRVKKMLISLFILFFKFLLNYPFPEQVAFPDHVFRFLSSETPNIFLPLFLNATFHVLKCS